MGNAAVRHCGEVIRVEGSTVFVRMKVESACAACHARGICGAAESADKIVEVSASAADSFRAGEEVVVALEKSRMGAESVVLAYVAPFFVLMALLVAFVAAGAGEGTAALVSLAGVALYYLLLYMLRGKVRNSIKFTITKQTK